MTMDVESKWWCDFQLNRVQYNVRERQDVKDWKDVGKRFKVKNFLLHFTSLLCYKTSPVISFLLENKKEKRIEKRPDSRERREEWGKRRSGSNYYAWASSSSDSTLLHSSLQRLTRRTSLVLSYLTRSVGETDEGSSVGFFFFKSPYTLFLPLLLPSHQHYNRETVFILHLFIFSSSSSSQKKGRVIKMLVEWKRCSFILRPQLSFSQNKGKRTQLEVKHQSNALMHVHRQWEIKKWREEEYNLRKKMLLLLNNKEKSNK